MEVYIPETRRARSCNETLALVRPFFGEAGITRIADVSGLDVPRLPVFVAVRPNSRSLSISQGKGITKAAARISAVMEALEHYHAEHPQISLRMSTRHALGETIADVDRLPRLTPYPLHPEVRLLWTQALALDATGPRWVPFEMVHLDLVKPLPTSSGCFPVCSNGLASGNDLEEASVHALYELIERDAWTLFREATASAAAARRLDLASIADPQVRAVIAELEGAGILVALWDITSDIGVSCILAQLLDREPNPYRPVGLAYGCGCHAEVGQAALRALTEAAQGRVTDVVGTRDDTTPASLAQIRSGTHVSESRQRLLSEHPTRSMSQVPHRDFPGYAAELAWLTQTLKNRGFSEVLRVDLSRADWPISVVRMLVPGLEGFHAVPELRLGARGTKANPNPLERR